MDQVPEEHLETGADQDHVPEEREVVPEEPVVPEDPVVAVLKDSLSGCGGDAASISQQVYFNTVGDPRNENSAHLDPESLSRNGHG